MEVIVLSVILLGCYSFGYYQGEQDFKKKQADEAACPISGERRGQ